MAEEKQLQAKQSDDESGQQSLIDPIYKQFVRSVTRAIGSTEFYEYFMDAISGADNEFQFSNRKVVKNVDTVWVDAVDGVLQAFQNIIASPRNVIKEEELIVNVANARKAGAETVRHLAQHSALVEDFDFDSGDVRPSKLMQRYREDSTGLYENRLVYTTLELASRFVKIRYDALLAEMGDEYGAKLKVRSNMQSATEHVHMDMFLHIKELDSAMDTDSKHETILNQIARMHRILSMLMNTGFAEQMARLPRVKGTINKTNILKRSKDYHKVLLLYEFLKSYDSVGYSVEIVEQAPDINEQFEQDIYRNILFNYLILKGYLQDEEDCRVPVADERRQTLNPKFIKEIIEEVVEDYDLTDVEVRKILIEHLTKEQLMQEEASERLRLVEEQERRLSEEERQLAAQRRLQAEQQYQKDQKFRELYAPELDYFKGHLQEHLLQRRHEEETSGLNAPKADFADVALKIEQADRLKQEAEEAVLRQKELATYKQYMEEIDYFKSHLEGAIEQRILAEEEEKHAEELRQIARQERMQEIEAKKQNTKRGLLKWRRG